MTEMSPQIFATAEYKSRDAYGFSVRPQHLQRYREHAKIYKEEEDERSQRWKVFLERLTGSDEVSSRGVWTAESDLAMCLSVLGEDVDLTKIEKSIDSEENFARKDDRKENPIKCEGSEINVWREDQDKHDISKPEGLEESDPVKDSEQTLLQTFEYSEAVAGIESNSALLLGSFRDSIWANINPSLGSIEQMMSYRVKRMILPSIHSSRGHLASIDEATPKEGFSEEDDFEEVFYDLDRVDVVHVGPSNCDEASSKAQDHASKGPFIPWKEELECLVQGGLPMGLRQELWQVFVGVRVRKVDGYYQKLLAQKVSIDKELDKNGHQFETSRAEKWKGQIEKDLPRTFPGHPALDVLGRNALRRILTAYAHHNPSVGYCQAMNFFAGLLLLLMPEENAFWTLLGIMDDYFEGYYSEEMIESQVDQLVFEDIVREKFPKLVSHLDYLGVQVAWVTGPWFLSIFVNMLPWESVLRVWDVLLFDGDRVMLFRTALALMELYGPALVTTKDAGDAVTLLQSLAGSTFDSSQLVLTACMGYQTVNEVKLLELRDKYRPEVIDAMEKRSRGVKNSKDLASKLYSFKHDPGSLLPGTKSTEESCDAYEDGHEPEGLTGLCNGDAEFDLKEQVKWLKIELCKLLEEKKTAVLRAEELETALVEMVKQDNSRLLCAKVEQLEQEVSELRQALTNKQEQERAMIHALMKVEQGQKVAEDARSFAEQDAAAKKYAAHVLQEKYEETMNLLAQMEKRAVMAETMLEATLQYQHGQGKILQETSRSPRTPRANSDSPVRKDLLSRPFVFGWRDKNKGKQKGADNSHELISPTCEQNASTPLKDANEEETSPRVEGKNTSFFPALRSPVI